MGNLSRRHFVAFAGAAGLTAALPNRIFAEALGQKSGASAADDFTFLFITDTHIQPE